MNRISYITNSYDKKRDYVNNNWPCGCLKEYDFSVIPPKELRWAGIHANCPNGNPQIINRNMTFQRMQ